MASKSMLLADWVSKVLYMAVYMMSSYHGELAQYLHTDANLYCQKDNFTAECDSNQVILMKTSILGRMSMNKCAKRDYGHGTMGCQMDVLNFTDWRCSGRRTCRFNVFTELSQYNNPCPSDIAAYLNATYTCIDVRSSLPQTCIPGQNIELEGPSGYLASSDILNHRYGGDCPWHITAPPGQRINITLYNFARYRLSDSTNHYLSDGACYELGDILERGGQSQRLTLCKKHRKTHVYTSQTNSVNIQVKTDSALADYYFLLKYEVIGCTDFIPPPGGHVHRDGNELTVTCNSTGHDLEMRCEGGVWVGDEVNCSSPVLQESLVGYTTSFPYGVLVVVAIGVALGVFIGGLLLFGVIFYSKRRRQRNVTTTHYVTRRELEIASEDKYMGYTPEPPNHRATYCPAEVVTLQTFPNHSTPLQQITRPKNGSVGSCELEPDITKTTVTYGHATAAACTCPMLGPEPTYNTSCRTPHRPHTYESPTCL